MMPSEKSIKYTSFVSKLFIVYNCVATLARNQPAYQLWRNISVKLKADGFVPLYKTAAFGAWPHESDWELESTLTQSKYPFQHLEWLSVNVQNLTLLCNIYLLFKYIFLCLLEYELLVQYRYLDCFLLGRLLLNARSSMFCKFFSLLTVLLIVRWIVEIKLTGREFDLSCFQFLNEDYYSIAAKEYCEIERSFEIDMQLGTTYRTNEIQGPKRRQRPSQLRCRRRKSSQTTSTLKDLDKSRRANNFATSQLATSKAIETNYFRRPNRTPGAWLALSNHLTSSLVVICILAILLFLATITFQLPLLTTRLGFEKSYHLCVAHAREQVGLHRENGTIWAMILSNKLDEVPQTIDEDQFLLPMKDFVQLNAYHVIRIAFDILETIMLLLQSYLFLTASLVIVTAITADSRLYCDHLRLELRNLLAKLRLVNESFIDMVDNPGGRQRLITVPRTSLGRQQYKLKLDIARVQFMLADLFQVINSYNTCARTYVERYVLIWFSFSASTAWWIFAPGGVHITTKFEYCMVHALAIVFCTIFIANVSAVGKETRSLYELIGSCTALDPMKMDDKWILVTAHYWPISLNAHRSSNGNQMSTSLGLKILGGLSSLLFVISTFYYR